MALTAEWKHRIERWQKALWEGFYRPIGSIPLTGFMTKEHLTADEALAHGFSSMPPATRWGAKWEYAWLKGQVVLPKEAAGHRIALVVDPGKESLIWINGHIAGSKSTVRREVVLSHKGVAGERYDILMEAYAGHGPQTGGGGPQRYGTESIPEPGPAQAVIGDNTFGVWLDDVYQLAVDFTTLFELRNRLDPLSLRVSEIDQALMDTTMIADLELPEAEMLETARAARARLKPVLDCVNGSTAPVLFAFGHAHIDVAWLWPLAETRRKMARTVANQLALIAEYPDYRFLQSQPHLYTMLREDYPELYERFVAAVKSGRVIADGAMWVEADTNITGGESLIRQIMHGQRFFRDEFGIESKILWLPDVFGYSGALPQILRGCGVEGFSTQKITWTYNGGDPFPYNTFLWEGIDGTTVPAHIFTDYNSQTHPGNLLDLWETRLQKNGISTMIFSFGHGDGGGGPTRDHLEFLRREGDLEGLPRVRMSSPAEFFADLQKNGLPKERYVGELYFQAHRGTYTSQARTKKGNRRSEFALRDAEMWGTLAHTLNGFGFSARTLDTTWRKLLLNQFHDILPGSSIHRVYEEAEALFASVIDDANKSAAAAMSTFTRKQDRAVTVFNSLSWPRTALVELPSGLAEVTAPACGWTTVPGDYRTPQTSPVTAARRLLENDMLRAEFNRRGELVSLIDKETGREVMASAGNRFMLYKDVPTSNDAWDIDSMVERMPVTTDEPVKLEVIASGPLVAKLRLTRRLHDSTLTQIISLRRGSRRLDFATTVDWQESHKLLKVAFPVTIHANEAIHEIQFGHLRRPNHHSRPFDADRWEVSNHKWSALAEEKRGVAILNDCKYGLSVTGNSLNLTLLKSALAPDMTADKGTQTFTYALYSWNGCLADSNVVHEAYDLNCPVVVAPGAAAQPEASIFSLDAGNVIIDTVKPAEDGSSDIIVRLYESMRMATRCTLSTALPLLGAVQTDLLENGTQTQDSSEGTVKLDFRPFEIKTLRLKLRA